MPMRKEKKGRIESLHVTVREITGFGSHRQPNHHALIPRLIRMPTLQKVCTGRGHYQL